MEKDRQTIARSVTIPLKLDELVNEVTDKLFAGNRSAFFVHALVHYLRSLGYLGSAEKLLSEGEVLSVTS